MPEVLFISAGPPDERHRRADGKCATVDQKRPVSPRAHFLLDLSVEVSETAPLKHTEAGHVAPAVQAHLDHGDDALLIAGDHFARGLR